MTLEVLGKLPAERVLDIACGTGRLLEILSQRQSTTRLVGIDVVPAMLEVADRRAAGSVTFLQGDAGDLPFESGAFQLVVSTNALHYFSDADAALREMRRVLSSQGHVVITDWCRNFVWMKLLNRLLPWTAHAHVHVFGDQELEQSLRRAGFSIVETNTKKINWFWGLMTISATVT